MLKTALQDLKNEAEALLAKFRAGIAHTEEELVSLVHRAENAVSIHTASTAEFADGTEMQPGETTVALGDGVQVITGTDPATVADAAASADPAPAA